jgi:tight adherence protein C
METRVLLISLMAAIAAGAIVRAAVRHPRPLSARVAPYSAPARSRFGTVKPERAGRDAEDGRTAVGLVFGPIVRRLANGLASLVDASSSTSAELRLRQAGMRMTVEQYRTRQLAYTAGALAVGAFIGLALGRRAGTVILLAAAAGIWGATRWRGQLDRRISKRRDRMRAELYTMCQLLAIYLRTGDTPSGAVDRLIRRTGGEVSAELAEAAAQIRSGTTPSTALSQLTESTPEPSAARLYRLLAATWTAGGDPDALLSLADDLRSARREDLHRIMTKRQTAMALPLVMVIGPILILFVAAAIPHIVFGR